MSSPTLPFPGRHRCPNCGAIEWLTLGDSIRCPYCSTPLEEAPVPSNDELEAEVLPRGRNKYPRPADGWRRVRSAVEHRESAEWFMWALLWGSALAVLTMAFLAVLGAS